MAHRRLSIGNRPFASLRDLLARDPGEVDRLLEDAELEWLRAMDALESAAAGA